MIEIKKVLVIGAGTMGAGIAQWFCQQHILVHLSDSREDFLKSQIEAMKENWDQLSVKGKFTNQEIESFKHIILGKVNSFDQDYDLVIEAIVEDLIAKKELFKKVENFKSECIFASNTSSLLIKDISSDLSIERKKNFIGLHFFNPAPLMQLVEVITTETNSKNLGQEVYAWFESKGKKPALCKDSPAFIVNRVARNFYGESLRILDVENDQRINEIDTVLKEVGGFRMGPFELMDLIGIDVNLSVTTSVWKAFQEHPRFAPHKIQIGKVQKQELGKKTKKGFYQYE